MSKLEELEQIDYALPRLGKLKWFVISFSIFLFGLVTYFPFMEKLKDTIKVQLHNIPGCSINYEDLKLEFFLPKVIVTKLIIPNTCFNQRGESLKIESLFIYFRGLSFSPFGPHFKLETNVEQIILNSYLTVGVGGIALKIQENDIDLNKLKKILPIVKLEGKVRIDALAKFGLQEIRDLKLNIRSKDLLIPEQSINSIKLYNLRLNHLLLKANLEGKNLIIEDFILGDEDSPIRANFKGKIGVNNKNLASSELKITGEAAFSENFIDKYYILKLLLAKFDKKDEFYQIMLSGPLTNPTPSSPR